jgi:CTP:molybdopterin cytidylyltransferase MocA
VIWPRRFFGLLESLTGPQGGKRLLIELAGSCDAVLIADETVLLDVDAADDLPAASKARPST